VTIQRSDSESFHEFEHAGWQSIPVSYHQAFGELTTQAIQPLLDAVHAKSGISLLDIASGPGYVAAAALRRGATVVGVDFSAVMVAQAQRLYPGIQFREGDAEDLPFNDGAFDAAVMNYGLLHLERPEQALSEAQRVLCTGGRFAFTVWAKPVEAIGFGIVLRAIEQHGDLSVNLPPGPPFFRFSESSECVAALLAAGFDSPHVSKVPQIWRLPSGDRLFEIMRDSTVRTAGLLRAQKPDALNRIRDTVRQQTEAYRAGDIVELPMPAVLATASKR
jgi:ubiquinone/menaquinone biosynthesis C-methylase UbiE